MKKMRRYRRSYIINKRTTNKKEDTGGAGPDVSALYPCDRSPVLCPHWWKWKFTTQSEPKSLANQIFNRAVVLMILTNQLLVLLSQSELWIVCLLFCFSFMLCYVRMAFHWLVALQREHQRWETGDLRLFQAMTRLNLCPVRQRRCADSLQMMKILVMNTTPPVITHPPPCCPITPALAPSKYPKPQILMTQCA